VKKTKKKIKKRTIKVKKKSVKLKKQKKKKVVKRKTKKKAVTRRKKKVVKNVRKKRTKKKKRKRRNKIFMADIYSIINKVQMTKKKLTFASAVTDAPTIENTIRDVELKYNKIEMKTQVVFTVYPGENTYEEEEGTLILEIMDDEIPEIGQIFG